jgi:enoyl-CoA hydratase/carnithine racemase
MLFTGRELDASDALRIGLVDYVEGRETIDEVVDKYVQKLVSNSQYSIQVAKLTIEEIRDGATTESERVRLFRSAGFLHSDFHEGISALREHREPNYKRQLDSYGQ